MAKYLTPQILRVAGTGFPYSYASDLELMGLIATAEAKIDAYTGRGGDELLMAGFAPGPAITEKQAWNGATRRVYPRSRPLPVSQVTSFFIQTSQSPADGSPIAYVVLPNNVLINNDVNYMEVSSFSLIAATGAYVPLPTALIEPWAQFTYTCGYRVAELAYLLGDSGDHTIYHSLMPTWLTAQQTPVIYRNGVIVASGYTVDATNGKVTFAVANSASDSITADFTHAIPLVVSQATVMAVAEDSETFFARKAGLAGMDRWQAGGGVTYERIGTASGRRGQAAAKGALPRGGGSPEWDWRDMMDTFIGMAVSIATVAE